MTDKPSDLRPIVCGGRDYRDETSIFSALDRVHARFGIACIIEGAASGADHMAYNWAKSRGVEVIEFAADWKTHGRSAGPRRNRQMLNEGRPNGVVAFPGGRGTADMVAAAGAFGIPVWEPLGLGGMEVSDAE
jgi:hypothetical protein